MLEHWIWARELVAVLVAMLHNQDKNGMELYFTSCTKPYCSERGTQLRMPREFVDAMNKMKPKDPNDAGHDTGHDASSLHNISDAGTASTTDEVDPDDIRNVLNQILSMWQKEYKHKLTLIIVTDGVWSGITAGGKKSVATSIVTSLELWASSKKRKERGSRRKSLKQELEDRGLSIQFVQFGDDEEATKAFDYMDKDLRDSEGKRLPCVPQTYIPLWALD
jgi:hypothetical protein